ncbi:MULTISPECIES: magnesium transporter, partial [unclassified Vibrio]
MTVMNNTFLSIEALYSEQDIQAVSNAFQQYGREQQINLLNRMPLEDAVLVLGQCSLSTIQTLLSELEEQGFEKRSRHLAHQLGLIYSEVEPQQGYLSTGVLSHVRQRIGWIIALALLGIVSGLIIAQYEDILSQLVLLAIYMPVIAAAGGNTGTQAATLVIRALATGELKKRQWANVLWKELRVAICLALAIALVMIGRILLFSDNQSTGGYDINMIAYAIA